MNSKVFPRGEWICPKSFAEIVGYSLLFHVTAMTFLSLCLWGIYGLFFPEDSMQNGKI